MKRIFIVLGALLVMASCAKDVDTDGYDTEDVVAEVNEIQVEETDVLETQKETDVLETQKEAEPVSKALPYEPGEGIITENGPLKVVDGQLSNSKGEPIQLKGLSTHGLQWFGSFITDESINRFVNDWNIDVLRAAMYIEEDGYLTGFKNYVLLGMNNSIMHATNNGIYVIVDWHVHTDKDPMLHLEEAKEFFGMMAEKYANNENIIYEICNEPNGDITWEDNIKPYAEQVIPIIRGYDEDAVIIVGTPSWSQELDKAADNPLDFENILYTLHFYAGSHGQELRDVASYALDKGLGIFVTEWGTSRNTGGGGVFIEESDVWLDYLDENNISWCNWSISDKAESSAIFLPNIDINKEWPEDRISESGLYVRRKLLGND